MKRFFFFLFLFFYVLRITNYVLPFPTFALDPIKVTNHWHTYPDKSGQDQNYIPSDPNAVDTIPLHKTIQISESFNPILSGTDTNGNPVYQHQTIDKIKQNIDSDKLNTDFLRENHDYFARPAFDPFASATTSYYSSNSTRHSLSASVQKCLISNQIVDISTFIAGGNSVCIDREIKTPGGPIRVGEIVSALIKANDLLYYPDTNCPPNQDPVAFPSSVNKAFLSINYTYHLTLDQYRQLYLTGIEPVCANSLAQKVEHCDLNDKGEKINCEWEIRSQPLGSVPSQNIYTNYRPASAGPVTRNYSQTEKSPDAVDTPNPISWLAKFFKLFFDGELKETKTYSGPHVITTYVDTRQINTLQSYESTVLHLFPEETIKTQNLRDQTPSGTNEVTTDPGLANSILTKTLYQNLTPASWHF